MSERKELKMIQITAWLGSNRRVRIRADDRVSVNPDTDPVRFRKSGPGTSDPQLIQVLRDLLAHLRSDYPDPLIDSIPVEVDGSEIIAVH